jgi:hypothetical protein
VELLIDGGNADNGSQCGLAYVNSNNAFSNSNANIGARLKFYTQTLFFFKADVSTQDSHTIEPVSTVGNYRTGERWQSKHQ